MNEIALTSTLTHRLEQCSRVYKNAFINYDAYSNGKVKLWYFIFDANNRRKIITTLVGAKKFVENREILFQKF